MTVIFQETNVTLGMLWRVCLGLRLETYFPLSGPNDRSMPGTSTEKSHTADVFSFGF